MHFFSLLLIIFRAEKSYLAKIVTGIHPFLYHQYCTNAISIDSLYSLYFVDYLNLLSNYGLPNENFERLPKIFIKISESDLKNYAKEPKLFFWRIGKKVGGGLP